MGFDALTSAELALTVSRALAREIESENESRTAITKDHPVIALATQRQHSPYPEYPASYLKIDQFRNEGNITMTSNQLSALGLDPELRTICLYHNDPDGCCSGAIVRRATGEGLTLHAIEIGDIVPWDRIAGNDQVIMVDFSLALPDMERLRNGWSLVWVDHHKTSLTALGEAMADVPGVRSLDEAACVLTWQTFYSDLPVPQAVAYVGDRDIWRNALPGTKEFNEGLYAQDFSPENWGLWEPLLNDDDQLVEELMEQGEFLHHSRMRQIEHEVTERGFETSFEGHRTLAINHRGSGDMGEFIRQMGYSIGYCYAEVMRAGRLQTIVTLYSDQIDVSEIAHKHGGGGHPGAAGFQFDRRDRPFPPGSEGLAE